MNQPTGSRHGWAVRVLRYCLRKPGLLGSALAGTLLGTAATIAVPLVQRDILNNAILTRAQPVSTGVMALVAAAVLSFGGMWARRYLGWWLALDVQHDLRMEMFTSLSGLDGMRQDQLVTGQVVVRSTSDLGMIAGLIGRAPGVLGNGLLLVGSLIAMLVLSPRLTAVTVTAGLSLIGITAASRGKMFAAGWDAQQRAADLAEAVSGAVAGVQVVKGFGQEDRETARIADAGRRLYASRMRVVRLMARYEPALQAIPALGQIGVLAYGGYLTIHHQISLGTLLAFAAYIAQLASAVKASVSLIPLTQQARASVIRVFEVIDSRPVITEKPDAVPLTPGSHDIQFDNVTFEYSPAEPVLRGLSLRIGAGETVAIMGAAGSGKSTIAWLLSRFYDVTGGAIRIGGRDLRDVTIDSLRASVGLVTEESFLFTGTIRANICCGRPDATGEQIRWAARSAGADEFISKLPDGYETVLGERGLTLSGGQRQRLALARTLIIDPPILLLDDATSAVDPLLEARIHRALGQVTARRTTLLFTHRPASLWLADKIAFLDDGRLVDFGTHKELTARCPPYRRLLTGREEYVSETNGRGAGDVGPQRTTPALWSAPPALRAALARLPAGTDVPDAGRGADLGTGRQVTLGRLLRPFVVAIIAGLVLDGLDVLAGIAVPWLMRSGVDHGIEGKALYYVIVVTAIALAIVFADWGVNIAQTMIVGRNGERLLYTLRVKVFAQLQRLGLDFYEREMGGQTMTRITTDVDAMSSFLQTGLIIMVNSCLTLAGVTIALLLINARPGLVLLCTLPLPIAATAVFLAKAPAAYAKARQRFSAVNAGLQESMAGLRVIQACGQAEASIDAFRKLSRGFLIARLRAQRYIALYFSLVEGLEIIGGALVLYTAASAVRDGTLTAGSLVAYLLYVDMLFAPVQELSQVFDGFQQAGVGLARIAALLREPTSTPESECPVRPGRLRGEIELIDVRFRYPDTMRDAMAGVNLLIAPGQTVAIVGSSGAGKSTLVKLIARFYDVTDGTLLIDGVDIRDYDLGGYRGQLGVVPQEPYLFPGTVRDAIGYGRPGATAAEIEAAASAVGAMRIISRLPGGFNYMITERGRNLSAGQRQLIALARAYLVDPAILLLDEATAALDPAAEAQVAHATARLTARRTTVLVAHRLTTAARADRIVVLDAGRITEIGTHGELIAARGGYATLCALGRTLNNYHEPVRN